jgi:threonine dehydrogenase-like Zn-dependent dehydrogenase
MPYVTRRVFEHCVDRSRQGQEVEVVHSYILQDVEMLGRATTVDPVCGADDAILKIEAVSVCSTDISYYRGHLTPVSWPLIPGHEVVGTVVEVGERSDPRVSVGDRLTYWGQIDFFGLAEYRMITPLLAGVALEEQNWFVQRGFRDASHAAVAHVPSGMPANTATLAEPLTSVLRSLLSCPPKPGDLVVVLGCGPAGLLSIQVLRRLLAAGTIIAMDVDPQRLALATRYGADETAQPVDLDGAARPTDPGLGFADYVFDALPHIATSGRGSGIRTEAMDMLRAGGTYTIYGATSLPQQINTWPVLAKGLTVRAAAFDVGLFPMRRTARVLEMALDLLHRGLIDTGALVTETVRFDHETDVVDAFASYGSPGRLKTSILF